MSELMRWTGLCFWIPVCFVLFCMLINHIYLVAKLYYRLFKMPFKWPWREDATFLQKFKTRFISPHRLAYLSQLSIKNPDTKRKYYLTGKEDEQNMDHLC